MKPQVLGITLCSFLLILPLACIEALTVTSEEPIQILLEKTQEQVGELQIHGADEVYAAVEKNLARMEELKKLTDPKLKIKPEERATKIADLLKLMRDEYTALAEQSPKIEEGLKGIVKEIKLLIADPKEKVRELEKEQRALHESLRELSPSKEPDAVRRNILEQSIKAQLASLEGEMGIWKNFVALESKIAGKAEEWNKLIGDFLLILRENAKIYNGAYRFAKANKEYTIALNSLDENVERIKDTSKKLLETWYELRQIMEDTMQFTVKPQG